MFALVSLFIFTVSAHCSSVPPRLPVHNGRCTGGGHVYFTDLARPPFCPSKMTPFTPLLGVSVRNANTKWSFIFPMWRPRRAFSFAFWGWVMGQKTPNQCRWPKTKLAHWSSLVATTPAKGQLEKTLATSSPSPCSPHYPKPHYR